MLSESLEVYAEFSPSNLLSLVFWRSGLKVLFIPLSGWKLFNSTTAPVFLTKHFSLLLLSGILFLYICRIWFGDFGDFDVFQSERLLMSLFQIQIVRMVEVTERQEPKLWCRFAVILIKVKPVVPVTDIVNSADKVTKESVVWRKRWKRRQKCKNSNCWASHQITDPGGCSSHW